ncbi:MAG: gamma-glutamylcyclotransferase [Pyrinomonadaceae bacterium]|nr:gamma-glutamylcyclotransferase [Pyrinomonadaceae bacterium]
MKEYLFSYGTLQQTDVQHRLFGRTVSGRPDVLDGYKISAVEITDDKFLAQGDGKIQKTLVPTGTCGDFVRGTALELTHDELLIVDKYEPENYKRMAIRLESGTNAWVFIEK